MANEWQEQPLSSLCVYLSRGAAPAYTDSGGILVLNQKCVRDQRVDFALARRTDPQRKPVAADRVVQSLDILVNSTGVGTLGRVAQVRTLPEMATVDSHVTLVRPDSRVIDPQYLGLAIRCFESEIEALGEGSTGQTELSRARLGAFLIPMPTSLKEQRAIARILGTLDDKIELNRKQNETLEAMARALFKAWFVDFEPVRAKIEGRWLRSQSLPGMPAHLYDLFLDRLVESELGEIPEGWELGRLTEVTGFLGGYAFKSKDWIEQGVPVVKIGSVKPGIVDLSANSHVSKDVAERAKSFRLATGDLLIGMTGYVGEVGIVPPTDNPPLLNQRVGKFVLEKPGTANLGYLYCLTRQPGFKREVESKSHGTAQANVSAEGILSIRILVPPRAVRDRFNGIVQPIIDQVLESHAESKKLAQLRDTLLPKLISGELRVPDAERIVGAVV